MNASQLRTARRLRARIAGGADPRACTARRTARGRMAVYAGPDGMAFLRGTLASAR